MSARLTVASGRRLPWLALLLIAALAVAYLPTARWWLERTTAPRSDWAHGPLVPFLCAWLCWRRWRSDPEGEGNGDWRALPFLAAGLVLLLAATVVRIDFFGGLSFLVVVPALAWLLWGFDFLRRHSFAFAFLGFAIPLPLFVVSELTQRLKEWVLLATQSVFGWFAEGVRAEGSALVFPGLDGRLLVDDECSGLRSLVALIALGILMAGTSRRGPWVRTTLAALAVPIALIANLARVWLLCGLALGGGIDAARRWHDASGYLVYAFALLAYLAVDRWTPGARERAS